MRQIQRPAGRPNRLLPPCFAGFTFRRLASGTGYSISQLIRVFSGQSEPGADLLLSLAAVARVPAVRLAKLLANRKSKRNRTVRKENNG